MVNLSSSKPSSISQSTRPFLAVFSMMFAILFSLPQTLSSHLKPVACVQSTFRQVTHTNRCHLLARLRIVLMVIMILLYHLSLSPPPLQLMIMALAFLKLHLHPHLLQLPKPLCLPTLALAPALVWAPTPALAHTLVPVHTPVPTLPPNAYAYKLHRLKTSIHVWVIWH